MSIYRGFNTVGRDFGPYRLVDDNLIKRDLINHFYIRKGEKLHNPEFGSIIWDRLFDPMTADLKEELRQDIDRIVRYDPRILVVNQVTIQEVNNGLEIDIQIVLSQDNQLNSLRLLFDRDVQAISILS
jgi:phage baseplate assembly protein W